jgi:hypothetical protein
MSYHDSSSGSLAPRTTARLARDVRDLLVAPENGVRLVVDPATGLPSNLRELTVRTVDARTYVCLPWLVVAVASNSLVFQKGVGKR